MLLYKQPVQVAGQGVVGFLGVEVTQAHVHCCRQQLIARCRIALALTKVGCSKCNAFQTYVSA
jgi:hypothetical protein